MKLRYYEDIGYRTRGGKFSPAPGKVEYIAFSIPGRVRGVADGEASKPAGGRGSAGAKVVRK